MPAPTADRRRGSTVAQSHAGPAEIMYVREYNRGREIRTTPIQGAEVIAMPTSLVGENQAMSKRKVCMPALRSTHSSQEVPLIARMRQIILFTQHMPMH